MPKTKRSKTEKEITRALIAALIPVFVDGLLKATKIKADVDLGRDKRGEYINFEEIKTKP